MPAPVSIVHTHVHSMRLANGDEALVARVLTKEGVSGFGFTLNFEAIVARDMAAWDAAARSRAVPIHALLGRKNRERVQIVSGEGGAMDPFAGETLEDVRRRAHAAASVALLAPHAHAWEISYCAALAATLSCDVRIAVPGATSARSIIVSDVPGIAIDWSAEPGFASLRWFAP